MSQNKIFLNWLVIYPQNQEKFRKMEEYIPLEAMMTSADVTGWPAIVRKITNNIDFDNLLKCRQVSTAFKYFLDNNRDVWLKSLDGVQHEYLDKLLSEGAPEPTFFFLPMSPEEVMRDHMSWMVVLEKIKKNGTIADIILFGKLMKQSKKLINGFRSFCPIENLFWFYDVFGGTKDGIFGLDFNQLREESAELAMKLFQTFLRLSLEEEDRLIPIHQIPIIEIIGRSQNPEVVKYFMTKMISFDPIETRDGIKIIAEKIWIQNSKKLFSYGIGLFLLAILLGLEIHKYHDQIQELDAQITQSIKDTLEPLGPYLEEAKAKILGFLGDIKQKVLNLP